MAEDLNTLLAHGVLFQNFRTDADPHERPFTENVVLPAVRTIAERDVQKSLLCRLYPENQIEEEDIYGGGRTRPASTTTSWPTPASAASRLTKSLYRRGYPKEDVLELYRFIDWVLELPEEREEEFLKEVRAFEEGEHMEYVTSAERIGRQQGWREGRQEGRQEGRALLLTRQLTRRFGGLPKWAEERLAGADVAQLEGWAERILDAHTLDEVFGEK